MFDKRKNKLEYQEMTQLYVLNGRRYQSEKVKQWEKEKEKGKGKKPERGKGKSVDKGKNKLECQEMTQLYALNGRWHQSEQEK